MKNKKAGSLPKISLEAAEKALRDIARRNGESIRKRRSVSLKKQFGDGYGVIDSSHNILVSGGDTPDGCDLTLKQLAKRYEADADSTPWQHIVIKAVLSGKV